VHKRRLPASNLPKHIYIHRRTALSIMCLDFSLPNVLQHPVRVLPPPNAN
jgi:hypothetical protein